MDYEKKYNEALERARKIYNAAMDAGYIGDCKTLEVLFPELKESEDEKIRNQIINFIEEYGSPIHCEWQKDWIAWLEKQGKCNNDDANILNRFSFYSYKDEPNVIYLAELYVDKEHRNKGIGTKILEIADEVAASMKCNLIRLKTEICSQSERLYRKNGYKTLKREGNQVWLEKQGESNKSLYIRFGDIPSAEKSKIYRNEEEIGVEEGVSVYPAFEDKDGNIVLGLNLPITKTSLHTQQHLLEYESRPCYLVTGDYVGKGSDGEPLIKNVRIIKKIKTLQNKEE